LNRKILWVRGEPLHVPHLRKIMYSCLFNGTTETIKHVIMASSLKTTIINQLVSHTMLSKSIVLLIIVFLWCISIYAKK
jgi:hypothetical protein